MSTRTNLGLVQSTANIDHKSHMAVTVRMGNIIYPFPFTQKFLETFKILEPPWNLPRPFAPLFHHPKILGKYLSPHINPDKSQKFPINSQKSYLSHANSSTDDSSTKILLKLNPCFPPGATIRFFV
ncbi:hypothetical protein SEVIR_3G313200v4 [Setaria viridis]|uniref:Uncharacterized protein n=1 Tax=Setaria viridis TaxID=4556 RepID=A0A4U6VL73_SETVI|nr:hypothetical protein SEVIR_3G313200v2 [Setaria viridis]